MIDLHSHAGEALGVQTPDLSGSATGVMPTAPTAYYRGLAAMMDLILMSGKWALGKEPTKQEWYDMSKNLPHIYRNFAANMLRDYPGTTPQRDVHNAGRARAEIEKIFSYIGMRSTREKAEMTTDRMDQLQEHRITKQFSRIEARMKDSGITPEIADQLVELSIEFGRDPSQIMRAYETFLTHKGLSPDERRALAAKSLAESSRYMRFLERQSSDLCLNCFSSM